MRGKNQHVVPRGDGWAVRGAGNKKPTRARETQSESIGITQRAVVGALICALSATAAGQWESGQETDPFTDKTQTWARVEGKADAHTSGLGQPPGLTIRCREDKFDIIVSVGAFLGGDIVEARYRIDKETAVAETWFGSTTDQAAFAAQERRLARKLQSAENLLVELTDFRGTPHRASFKVGGGAKAIKSVLRSCGIEAEGLDASIPGLRPEIGRWLERWGPRNIELKAAALTELGWFKGGKARTMTPALALAVQGLYDDFVKRCLAGEPLPQSAATLCSPMRLFAAQGLEHPAHPPGVVITVLAPPAMRQALGELRIGD